jgi:dihydropyrimidine dehydrogenase (NAD+) subunit PreT
MIAERFFLLLAVAGVLALAGFTALHRGYYALPDGERPAHDEHARLRSSGPVGLTAGLVGTGAFLLNLSYLVRKRFARARWLGSLRAWMGFHVATGLLGASLILLHAAYLPKSALGILASAALAVVVATGLIGRYLYGLVPRSLSGRELEREELRRRLDENRARLLSAGFDPALLERPVIDPGIARRGVVARVARVVAGDRDIRRAARRMRKHLRNDALLPVIRRYARDEQWLARYAEARALLGAWRFLHLWLAVAMLSIVGFHIFVAIRFGGVLG